MGFAAGSLLVVVGAGGGVVEGGERGEEHGSFELRRLGPPYPAGPSQLADVLGLTRGALSARLGPIEETGLITRANDAADRRRVRVRLTAAGYDAFEQHASSEEQGEDALLSVLTEEEKKTLADLLRKLVVAVESGPDAARVVVPAPSPATQVRASPPSTPGTCTVT